MLLRAVIGRLRSSKTSGRTGPGPVRANRFSCLFFFSCHRQPHETHRSMNHHFAVRFFPPSLAVPPHLKLLRVSSSFWKLMTRRFFGSRNIMKRSCNTLANNSRFADPGEVELEGLLSRREFIIFRRKRKNRRRLCATLSGTNCRDTSESCPHGELLFLKVTKEFLIIRRNCHSSRYKLLRHCETFL